MNNNNNDIRDFGANPLVIDIDKATKQNQNFRSTLWTGNYMQVTLMSIKPGADIGIERHDGVDQFIRIEDGHAIVKMGSRRDYMQYQSKADGNYAIIIPSGMWHNIINIGNTPLKLYSIYAPPSHPFGTVNETKEAAQAEENH